MKKFNAALFVLILCLALGSVSFNLMAQEREPVAQVNGVEISKDEFYALLEKEYGSYALRELILKELVNQQAAALSVEVAEEQFNELYSLFEAQLGGPQGVELLLMENNMTEAQFKDQLHWNLLITELARSEVEVNEEAITAWFEENRFFYDQPESVEVSHILVESEEEANEILAALRDDADFAELAREKSTDAGSASLGGYLGHIQKGQTVPEFEDQAFTLLVGEYGLAKSDFGWHVILVHEKRAEQKAVLDDIYEIVESDYTKEQALDIQLYLEKLETEADIQIFLDL